ncbi:UDP-N-acetylglucosamine 2-epimerase [Acetobacterium wieringae]|uniref:GDP/UDP-N,N'-diacetylbacillosamine 2-epimerase (Hydrolyzing) n=1 Tax=Acetobacterium wieringae TaxID=52694 RepID=A0A1F2PFE0_9FIRM|nr:UDP-N-acetylglucosamine 2-epimerase [Acetobacterium wieringae]OFV70018.1 GDP/UDP-N,N'-diacetylbacillosamine 2-epimerase (hydrolyzing) [Acetobacterium wieringae]
MIKICLLTATRAEYGLLKRVIQKLQLEEGVDVRVVVTGAHLAPEFGLTYKEIEEDGIEIDEKIEILISSDSPMAISKSMGLAMIGFADYFERSKPDLLVVLGDRYETLAVCCSAVNHRIPIAHLYGGETTEGAVDEAFRHAITKMSYLHFTSTEAYRKRVIQLGEDPERIYNVGALGVENSINEVLFTKTELEESLSWKLDSPYGIVTFHPVTLENDTAEHQVLELLKAIEINPQYQYLFTKANADSNGRIINDLLDKFVKKHENCRVYHSLGMKRYLSAVKYASFVMGNSSSGIVEVPSFGIPTINIGDRQKGRLQSESVINCQPVGSEIDQCIRSIKNYRHDNFNNPYEKVNTSMIITETLIRALKEGSICIKKKFYDLGENA